MRESRRLLGQILVEMGMLAEADLASALAGAAESRMRLGEYLRDKSLISDTVLARALAEQQGIPFVNLADSPPAEEYVAMLPEELSRKYRAVVIGLAVGGRLRVAMVDPLDVIAIDRLRGYLKRDILPVATSESQLLDTINSVYRLDEKVEQTLKELPDEQGRAEDDEGELEEVPDAPVVRLVNTVIEQAVRNRASDIHIDPGPVQARVRLRVDGVLSDLMSIPRRVMPAVVSRLKIMGGMDIGERRLPLDGRCSVATSRGEVDLRIATVPGIHGEKVTVRVLDKSQGIRQLDKMGFEADELERYRSLARQPYGMILATGPTGSGKTTTLYATLTELNDPGKNIITMEDPVEYQLGGVTQIQVNRKAGLVFATGLRSILRMDPDIILVGEIRDSETAEIAVQSALTGHLVLSTLHTNDAPGALTRLVEMGIEPFLVASSVIGVLAQRLVRRLCLHCRAKTEPDAARLKSWGLSVPADADWYDKVGCPRCSGTGYQGRTALAELLVMTHEVRQAVLDSQSADVIGAIACSQGMRTLLEAGMRKVHAGETTLEEVLRVVRLERGDGHAGTA